MSILVRWYNTNQDTIYAEVVQSWDWNDFYQAIDQMHQMMDESPLSQIDIIMDVTEGNLIPSGMVSKIQRVSQRSHPKIRTMYMVGVGNFMLSMFRILQKIIPARSKAVKFVKTLGEVEQLRATNF